MRAWATGLILFGLAVATAACDGDPPPPGTDGGPPPGTDGGVAPPPGEGCNSVRLTNYVVGGQGWCEFPRDLPMLPAFVRDEHLTAAIAEPFNGSSFGGEPGESCGECWEVDSLTDTRVVMITDLCPNEGNPLCQGAHFHLDISSEASEVLNAGFLDEGSARRVPCPVDGNIHLYVNDDNISYLRVAFVNHRVPIRSATFRSTVPGSPTIALRRSGGAWEALDEMVLDRGGEGITFTLTSAEGQTVESTVVVPTHPPMGSTFDLGVQLDELSPPSGGACEFVPPGVIFDDAFGGIDLVRWMINPWGEAESGFFGPTEEGCRDGACLLVETLGQWSGFHLFYRGAFPPSTFTRLVMQVSADVPGEIQIAPSHEGERCEMTRVAVGPGFQEVTIDLATVCGGLPLLNAVTIDNPSEATLALRLDDVRFER